MKRDTAVPLLRDPPDERPPSFERPKVVFQEGHQEGVTLLERPLLVFQKRVVSHQGGLSRGGLLYSATPYILSVLRPAYTAKVSGTPIQSNWVICSRNKRSKEVSGTCVQYCMQAFIKWHPCFTVYAFLEARIIQFTVDRPIISITIYNVW